MEEFMIMYSTNNIVSKTYVINSKYEWVKLLIEYLIIKYFHWIENEENRKKNYMCSLELVKSVYFLCKDFTENESIHIMVNWRNQLDSLKYLDDTPEKDNHKLSPIFDYFEENNIDIDNLKIDEDIIKKTKWNKKYESDDKYKIFIQVM